MTTYDLSLILLHETADVKQTVEHNLWMSSSDLWQLALLHHSHSWEKVDTTALVMSPGLKCKKWQATLAQLPERHLHSCQQRRLHEQQALSPCQQRQRTQWRHQLPMNFLPTAKWLAESRVEKGMSATRWFQRQIHSPRSRCRYLSQPNTLHYIHCEI